MSTRRVLLNPDPNGPASGGGPAPEPTPTPGPTPTPSPTQAQPSINDLLTQQVAQVHQLQAELQQFKAQQAAAAEAAEAARLKLIADKEGAEKALEEQRKTWEAKAAEEARRAQELQSRFYQAERDRTLATSLAGVEWHDAEAARTAHQLLADRFETRANPDGSLAVVEKATGRPASDVIGEAIDRPPFTYLQKPKGGGTGKVGGGTPPSPQDPGPPDYNRHLIERWKQAQAAAADAGMPALGYGFRPGTPGK